MVIPFLRPRTLIRWPPPHYVSTGHLIYARGEELLARRFDLATQEVGLPVSVLKGVLAEFRWQIPQFAISESGVLVYAEGGVMSGDSSLVWVDRSGEVSPMTPEKKEYDRARISPGGDQLVYSTLGREPGLWIHDIARGSHVSLASGQTYYTDPVWSPDGEWIAFSSTLEGMINLFRLAADGTGGLQRLNPHSDVTAMASSWSLNGQVLAFSELDVSSAGDIWLVSNQQGAEPDDRGCGAHRHGPAGAGDTPPGRCFPVGLVAPEHVHRVVGTDAKGDGEYHEIGKIQPGLWEPFCTR